MTCGCCKHWDTSGHMGQHGYGKCQARAPGPLREGHTTSAQNPCRIGKFAQAEVKVVRMREQKQGVML